MNGDDEILRVGAVESEPGEAERVEAARVDAERVETERVEAEQPDSIPALATPVAAVPAALAAPSREPRLARLLAGLWFGAGAFILIAAAAVFRAAESPMIAANVVGAMLTRWHYLALLVPVALLFLLRHRARPLVTAALFTAVILASVQAFADLRIRQIRASTPLSISALDRDDPLRRQFGMLHGLSSLLLVLQVLAAAAVVSETR